MKNHSTGFSLGLLLAASLALTPDVSALAAPPIQESASMIVDARLGASMTATAPVSLPEPDQDTLDEESPAGLLLIFGQLAPDSAFIPASPLAKLTDDLASTMAARSRAPYTWVYDGFSEWKRVPLAVPMHRIELTTEELLAGEGNRMLLDHPPSRSATDVTFVLKFP